MKHRTPAPREVSDDPVDVLTALFREHPAWRKAARFISRESKSNVYFTHRPGEAWHLARGERGSDLVTGRVDDPDFVFRFSPGAVTRLQGVEDGLAEFALELFSLIEADDADERVDLRVAASFARLREHGFLSLLLAAGPRVAAYGLRHGVTGVGGLAKFVRRATNRPPCEWEA